MSGKEGPEIKTAFCEALADTAMVSRACKAAGISRQTAYRWRRQDAEFAAEWEAALQIGVTALEDEAHRRAFMGTDKPVFYKGQQCGSIREYSDTLAIFLLKAHRPEKYRDNARVELTGANGGPVQLSNTDRAARIAYLVNVAKERKLTEETGEDLV